PDVVRFDGGTGKRAAFDAGLLERQPAVEDDAVGARSEQREGNARTNGVAARRQLQHVEGRARLAVGGGAAEADAEAVIANRPDVAELQELAPGIERRDGDAGDDA